MTTTVTTSAQDEPNLNETIARIKRMTVWCLAALWLLDAVLQAQPNMYTLDFINQVMKPGASIAAGPLVTLATWTTNFITPHIGEWNWFFTTIQFAIAISLLMGLMGKNERLIRGGLILSIVWGLGVWVFGEGTSGVFTGNGTLLTGAPGSVFLYVLLAAFYFLPDARWNLRARFCLPRDALALVFVYGVVAQVLTQPFWGEAGGISNLVSQQTAMAPSWMVPTMSAFVSVTSHMPSLWNALFTIAMVAVAVLMFGRHPMMAGFVVLGVTLVVIWYWGQAFGGIFSGMGTDPNTPPLFLVMAMPAWTIYRERVVLRREVHTDGGRLTTGVPSVSG